jgi:hypothetical protein
MRSELTEKLQRHIAANNPDLLHSLPAGLSITDFIADKVASVMPLAEQLLEGGTPPYIIEEICMNDLTEDLRPSKFHYIRTILEEDFLATYNLYERLGVLTYEIINLVETCEPVFEKLGFTEDTEDDRMLRYAITGAIAAYMEESKAKIY